MESLYKSVFGSEPCSVNRLAGAGSSREYYRAEGADGRSAIVTHGTDVNENSAFLYLSRLFVAEGLPVPEVLGVSSDGMDYLQSDLGDVALFDMIKAKGVSDTEVVELMRRTVRLLPRFQFPHAAVDYDCCFPRRAMDSRAAMWDLNYFKYCFLKAVIPDFDEDRLEDDFCKLAEMVTYNPEKALMLRDFQSRNVMIHGGEPYVIDFQGARSGSCLYDVASFLWQARAGIPAGMRRELVAEYVESLREVTGIEIPDVDDRLRHMVLFRTLQVLGAYGFRGYFERKAHFLMSIMPAVDNLREVVSEMDSDTLPYLKEVLDRVCRLPRFAPCDFREGLTVKVYSFSYKKGIPDDMSGNGGGFVFDCRAVHNPGRYDCYKPLTGLDVPVREFLEKDGEMLRFLESCYRLVDASVERYMERGFTSLTVSFGCTGGRHRSVYGAQAMAGHIWDRYGVRVELVHRERGITEVFEPR